MYVIKLYAIQLKGLFLWSFCIQMIWFTGFNCVIQYPIWWNMNGRLPWHTCASQIRINVMNDRVLAITLTILLIIKGCSIAMKEKVLLARPGTAHNYALKWPGAPLLPWCLHCHTLFVYNQLDSQAWGGMAEHLRVTVKLNFMNKLLWLIRPVSHVTPGPGWRHFISGELVFMVPLWVG